MHGDEPEQHGQGDQDRCPRTRRRETDTAVPHATRRGRRPGRLAGKILVIGGCCAALPDRDTRQPDEFLGYDENGLPS